MKCQQVKRYLVAYLDGEIEEQRKVLIKEHLGKCAECRREVDLLQKVGHILKDQEYLEPSGNFEARLWERIHLTEEKQLLPHAVFERVGHLILPAAVAVALIIGVIVGSLVGKIMPSQMVQLQEEYVASIGLDNFQDFPPGSLPQAYFSLVNTGEVKNQ